MKENKSETKKNTKANVREDTSTTSTEQMGAKTQKKGSGGFKIYNLFVGFFIFIFVFYVVFFLFSYLFFCVYMST